MKARIVLFLSFLLVSGVGYGQQAGFPLRFWGNMGITGNLDKQVRKVVVGGSHTLVLYKDSTVMEWGNQVYNGSTYNGSSFIPMPKNMKDIKDIAVGLSFSMALRRNGTVEIWGDTLVGFIPFTQSSFTQSCNDLRDPTKTNFVSIVAGDHFYAGLTPEGQIKGNDAYCCGTDISTFLAFVNNRAPFSKISASSNHIVALRKNGKVIISLYIPSNTAFDSSGSIANFDSIIDIAANQDEILMVSSDGILKSWTHVERPSGGHFYDTFTNINNAPDTISKVLAMTSGANKVTALRLNGSLFQQYAMYAGGFISSNCFAPSLSSAGKLLSSYMDRTALVLDNGGLIMWDCMKSAQSSIPQNLSALKKLSAYNTHFIALKSNGKVVSWGGNDSGQCTIPIGLDSIKDVATGLQHSVAVRNNGKVVAWGDTTYGQTRVPVSISNVVSVAAGQYHTLVLKSDSTVAAWGSNFFNQCAAPNGLNNVIAISAGALFSLALKRSGRVIAWGLNSNEQCDVPRNLSNVVAIAAGKSHCLALRSDGKVVAWGKNTTGQCNVPLNLSGVVSISAGNSHSVALRYDGSIVSWGAYDGNYPISTEPDNSNVRAISCGNGYTIGLVGTAEDNHEKIITGQITQSLTGNCNSDSVGYQPERRTISVLPGYYLANIDKKGRYNIALDSGTYQVSQVLSQDQALLQRQICPPNNAGYTASFAGRVDTVSGLNFANEEIACSRLEVQVSSNRRRRCFKNSTIIKYANSGYAAQAGVMAHLKLPRYMVLKSSSVAYTFNSVDSTYSFDLGTLAAGQSGQIYITDSVLCADNIRGLQQCTKAWLTPGIQPCQWPAGSDGSNIDVRGKCASNVPHFKLKNLGQTMSSARSYRVFADSLLAYQGTYNLAAGDSTILNFPGLARPAVLRLEAELDSLSPYGRFASDFASCGPIITSIGDNYATNSGNPVEATDCQEIRDSYDPNDKQVFPKGISAAGNIEPGTWLTYRLRFINKGNDTAYMVRIVDTLSNNLDLGSLQFGASSHRFVPKISGKGRPVLTLVFDPINLPDSARSGQAAASGFVDFRIRSSSSAPLGTQIKNHADILFDFNAAVRTNTVMNTLYRPTLTPGIIDTVIITATRKPSRTPVPFTIQPNPGNGKLTLTTTQGGQLQIISADGKVSIVSVAKGSNALDISHLPSGLYLLRLNGAALRYVRE